MSKAMQLPPVGVVRLTDLLAKHAGQEPHVDTDRPSIEIWVDEASGELRRWILVGIGEHTVTVMNPSDRHDRALRPRRGVWIRPDVVEFIDEGGVGHRRGTRATWTRVQAERGRQRAHAIRFGEEAQG